MTHSPITRRTFFALGAPSALVAIAACSSKSPVSKESSSASSHSSSMDTKEQKSASSSASSGANTSAKITATKAGERDEVGYHLATPKQGAPIVTLYTDYQCPYCAKAEPTYEKVVKELDGTMNVTVRNMPLSTHKNAVPAAQAVQAAELQGKHLEMANKLFETQDSWKDITERPKLLKVFLGYAKEFNLDEEKFGTDLVAAKTLELIKKDAEYAQKVGVKGTPQFVVNDKVLENVASSTSAEDMVKEFKKAAGLS